MDVIMESLQQQFQALRAMKRARILVVGDLMLDRFVWATAEKVSPEAPALSLKVEHVSDSLGGAAVVAQLCRGFEADVQCVGVLGSDAHGDQVFNALQVAGIDCSLVFRDQYRQTTVKERLLGRSTTQHPQQIMRLDYESREPLSEDIQEGLLLQLIPKLAEVDAVLISDYAKGVCTEKMCQAIIGAARECRVPVIVDPHRDADFAKYRGATAITPNRREAATAADEPIDTPAEGVHVATRLCDTLHVETVYVTLDRDGITWATRDGAQLHCPTETTQTVFDITGAGDTVFALLGIATAEAWPTEVAVQLANQAAGIQIRRLGVLPISRQQLCAEVAQRIIAMSATLLNSEQLVEIVECYRSIGATVVLANGCFDLLHIGHVNYLREAATLGDVLVVGVNSDASVRRLKGHERPFIAEQERASMLAALKPVAHVIIFEQDTPHCLIEQVRPDVLVKGGTYQVDEVVGREIVEAYGGQVYVTRYVPGVSTSVIAASVISSGAWPPRDLRGCSDVAEQPPLQERVAPVG